MKYLAPLLLSGCIAAPVVPAPATEPFIVDIGNLSLTCLYEGQVLRYLKIEGQEATQYKCVPPPRQPGEKDA